MITEHSSRNNFVLTLLPLYTVESILFHQHFLSEASVESANFLLDRVGRVELLTEPGCRLLQTACQWVVL